MILDNWNKIKHICSSRFCEFGKMWIHKLPDDALKHFFLRFDSQLPSQSCFTVITQQLVK